MSIPVLVLQWPATLEPPNEEVSAIEEEETWMTPIVWYLKDNILLENRNESRKIKKQAARYFLSQEVIYRRSFTGPYLRCVTPRKAARILVELHEEDCGSHSSGRTLVLRAKRAGYYWPTMAEEANKKLLGSKTVATKLTFKTSKEESKNFSTINNFSEKIYSYEELYGRKMRHRRKSQKRSHRRYVATECAFLSVATLRPSSSETTIRHESMHSLLPFDADSRRP